MTANAALHVAVFVAWGVLLGAIAFELRTDDGAMTKLPGWLA